MIKHFYILLFLFPSFMLNATLFDDYYLIFSSSSGLSASSNIQLEHDYCKEETKKKRVPKKNKIANKDIEKIVNKDSDKTTDKDSYNIEEYTIQKKYTEKYYYHISTDAVYEYNLGLQSKNNNNTLSLHFLQTKGTINYTNQKYAFHQYQYGLQGTHPIFSPFQNTEFYIDSGIGIDIINYDQFSTYTYPNINLSLGLDHQLFSAFHLYSEIGASASAIDKKNDFLDTSLTLSRQNVVQYGIVAGIKIRF